MNESIIPIIESSYTVLGKVNGNLANSILDKINAFICIIDTIQVKLLWANKYLIKRLGYSFEEIKNLTSDEILMLIHPDFREHFLESVKKPLKAPDQENQTIFKIRTKDGKWLWILANHSVYEMNQDEKNNCLLAFGAELDFINLRNQFQKLEKIENDIPVNDKKILLSCRQRMVLKLIAKGKTNKEIAEILSISVHTAKTHRKSIIHNLGFKNTGTLINFAIENGLG